MQLGHAALRALGFSEDRAAKVEADIRRRDFERLELQRAEGLDAGKHLLHRSPDEPLLGTAQPGIALNPEAEAVLGGKQNPRKRPAGKHLAVKTGTAKKKPARSSKKAG